MCTVECAPIKKKDRPKNVPLCDECRNKVLSIYTKLVMESFISLSKEDLLKIKGIGEETANSFVEFFKDKNNKQMLIDLYNSGVRIIN